MISQRKPKAPDLIYDACEAALPHVCTAIGYLDSRGNAALSTHTRPSAVADRRYSLGVIRHRQIRMIGETSSS
jgi:hypothetical protein